MDTTPIMTLEEYWDAAAEDLCAVLTHADATCPVCGRAGNGEPCAPYCGASDEATVASIDRAVLAMVKE